MSNEVEKKGNHVDFWLGVVLGGLVGAALALFVATDDKDELKKNLLKKGKILLKHFGDLCKDVEEKGEEIKEGVVRKIEKVKETANQTENQIHQKTRKFFLSKGKPLVKK